MGRVRGGHVPPPPVSVDSAGISHSTIYFYFYYCYYRYYCYDYYD